MVAGVKSQMISLAHFVFSLSCSCLRFWKCKVTKAPNNGSKKNYEWCEWEMLRKDQESTIDISGKDDCTYPILNEYYYFGFTEVIFPF